MKISEIFKSIQGESTLQGLPCTFIRLWGCNLRCSYCDTKYTYEGPYKEMSIEQIIKIVEDYNSPLVEITGGEPLLQEEVYPLCEALIKRDNRLLIETNGSLDIQRLPEGIKRIVDIKCPDSGMSDKVYWDNLKYLSIEDEVKFVLSSEKDYEWARFVIKKHSLIDKVTVLFSVADRPSGLSLQPKNLAEWLIKDDLKVRLQLQLHKYIWPEGEKTSNT